MLDVAFRRSPSRHAVVYFTTAVPRHRCLHIYWSPTHVPSAEHSQSRVRKLAGMDHQTGERASRFHSLVMKAYTETEAQEDEIQIEGIQRTYCDDFVCTSSPQVEQNVKALARDVTRYTSWTRDLFRRDVEYKDNFLSFKGLPKHQRLHFPRDCVNEPKVLVTKLRMLDGGKCQVDWRLRGKVAAFPLDMDFTSEFSLDLITGKVNAHREMWDLQRSSLPAKAVFLALRALWSLQLKAKFVQEDSSSLIEKWKPKDNEQQGGKITQDMNDPTKFFQEENDPSKDLFAIGAIIAFIYFIFQAYTEISKLK